MPSKMLKESRTLGERLKERREALGFSLRDVAKEIQTSERYVAALEEDRYEVFSAKVYAYGFFKKILELLNFENKVELLSEFNNEWAVRTFRKNQEPTPLPENRGEEPYLTPSRLGLGVGGVVLLIFVGFLIIRLIHFVGTPKLLIREPAKEQVVNQPLVRILGETEKESQLTVNGQEIKLDEQGHFDDMFELGTGLNALEFKVLNRFGKEGREVRYVIVK